ncbi:MAG: vitamin K epoxide reductase family protein [Anaerolineaceae bacterium]|nr:vitamin K epoxide reductase family protein [Anaerolineaceae bacterium]
MNQSINKLRLAFFILSAAGLVDALYLTWIKFTNNYALCIQGVGNCESVNTSSYAEIMGIPVAVLGAGTYLLILAIVLLETRIDHLKTNSTLYLFGITLIGVLFSAYLTFIEIVIIKNICPYCVISAILMTVLFILSIVRLSQGQTEINPE